MSRVATLPTQTALANALGRGQEGLADANVQLSTFKKVQDYAGLGSSTRSVLSAATLQAQQQAQSDVAKRVGTTLRFYDNSLSVIDDSMKDLKTKLLDAIGQNNGGAVNQVVKETFDLVRTALNASEAGSPIFAGGQTGTLPFAPRSLADVAALASPDAAFANDDTHASARIDGDTDVSYGITASEVGTGLVKAFQTLAGLGTVGKTMTQAQIDAINKAMGQIDEGVATVRTVSARNGDLQNHVDTLVNKAQDRITLLSGVIGDGVDADLKKVATELSLRTTLLNASYAAFTKLNGMSLADYLR